MNSVMNVELKDEFPVIMNGMVKFPLTIIIGETKETHYYSSELEREKGKRDFAKNVIPHMRATAKKYRAPET